MNMTEVDDITKLTNLLRALPPEQQRDIVPNLIQAVEAFTAFATEKDTPPGDDDGSSQSFGFSFSMGRSSSLRSVG